MVDGYHPRLGPKDHSLIGHRFAVRVSGSGGSNLAQQRITGTPVFTIQELPEQVRQVTTTLQLERNTDNEDDALEQWRKLNDLSDGSLLEIEEHYIDAEGHDINQRFIGYLDVQRKADVVSAEEPGVILAVATIRAINYFDPEDDEHGA